MAGEVLRFPRRVGGPQPLAPNVRPPPVLETFSSDQARELLAVAHHAFSGGRALIEFIDQDRFLARQAGIETIGIEVSSILADERIERVVSALEEWSERDGLIQISQEGLQELRRLERLLAEASNNINRFTDGGYRLAEASRARSDREAEGRRLEIRLAEQRISKLREEHDLVNAFSRKEQESLSGIDRLRDSELGAPSTDDSNHLLVGALIGLGVVTVAVVVVALTYKKK